MATARSGRRPWRDHEYESHQGHGLSVCIFHFRLSPYWSSEVLFFQIISFVATSWSLLW
jgi:hypothetical protein